MNGLKTCDKFYWYILKWFIIDLDRKYCINEINKLKYSIETAYKNIEVQKSH